MGLYRDMYPVVELRIYERIEVNPLCRIHGSEVTDIFVDYAYGRFCVDDRPEKILRELVDEGILVVEGRQPTTSQKAFLGFVYSTKGYRDTKWGLGTITHYWYRFKGELTEKP
jgi:hypothetical protein